MLPGHVSLVEVKDGVNMARSTDGGPTWELQEVPDRPLSGPQTADKKRFVSSALAQISHTANAQNRLCVRKSFEQKIYGHSRRRFCGHTV